MAVSTHGDVGRGLEGLAQDLGEDPRGHRVRHRGQARRRPPGAHGPARRGPPPHRGRPRRRQDDARQGARPLDRLLGTPGPVHPRPAAQRHHRGQRLQPGDAGSSSSSRARSSPTSSSATRSTAPRPRRSPRCWSAWRSARSPSTATPTTSTARSWSSRPRTRSRWRAPTRCPRPSATGSPPGSRWATPSPAAELEMLDVHGQSSPLDELSPVAHAGDVRGLIDARTRGARLPRRPQLRHRPGHRHPRPPRTAAGRLPAGHPAPRPRRPRVRRPRRTGTYVIPDDLQ